MIVRRRPRAGGAIGGVLLVAAQLLATLPVTAVEPTAPVRAASTESETTELRPGIHYEDAMAHAADRIDFEPGGRVTVGFRPRAGDAWEVAGGPPRALPAGTASGRELLSLPVPAAQVAEPAPNDTPHAAQPGG
ncbi:MAG TPA: hypothetical protein VK871_04075, partial [Candidatus Limnocylindrales bacterium]|nr:hypothetical protein [Candidatus Limnocylindrales bacterium]